MIQERQRKQVVIKEKEGETQETEKVDEIWETEGTGETEGI